MGLTALCVDYAVSSITALSTNADLSPIFIGLVLLPIPNRDLAPISQAMRCKLDTAMNYTIGKCIQTALFITPLTVLIA
jgi:Ca2+:H+ antiporter